VPANQTDTDSPIVTNGGTDLCGFSAGHCFGNREGRFYFEKPLRSRRIAIIASRHANGIRAASNRSIYWEVSAACPKSRGVTSRAVNKVLPNYHAPEIARAAPTQTPIVIPGELARNRLSRFVPPREPPDR